MAKRFSTRRMLAVIRKEFLQLRRDPASLGIGIFMPLVMLLLFGYAINTDVEHLSTGIWDQSKTRLSRELSAAYSVTGYFDIKYDAASGKELQTLMDAGKIQVGLIIPPDYAFRLEERRAVEIQVLIDGSEPTAARTALSAAQMISQSKARTLGEEGKKASPVLIEVVPRVLYNPDMDSKVFNIPGRIGLILQNVTALLTAFALVRERERGTMEQLIVTPVRPLELILGKLIPYVIIGLVSFTAIVLTGVYWFGVPVKGSFLLLFTLGLLFLVTTLAIGILVSTVAKTQLQAMQMAFAIILPSILLSGFIFPRESMPVFARYLGEIVPLTYFLIILRGIFLKGVSMVYLWQETITLAVFTLVICALAVLRFRKKLG